MLTWSFESRVKTQATAEQVWNLWSKPQSWPEWDAGLEKVTLEGDFVAGAQGQLKPAGGPVFIYRLTEVNPLQGFRDRSVLPATTLDFVHTYHIDKDGQRWITHRVEMKGLLTPLFRIIIGRGIRRDLPHTLSTLSEQAVRQKL
jgi:hypothetical protein